MKALLAVVLGVAAVVFLQVVVHDHDNLFVAAEAVHAVGICVLIYKLTKEKNCAGSNQILHSTHSLQILNLFLPEREANNLTLTNKVQWIKDSNFEV